MTMKTHDDSAKVRKPYVTLNRVRGEHPYTTGAVGTPLGFVTIYSQVGAGEKTMTRFDFIHKGRLQMRTVPRIFTERGLSIMAHRYAREIARLPKP